MSIQQVLYSVGTVTDSTLWKKIVSQKFSLGLLLVALTACSTLFIGIGARNALLPTGSHDLQWTPTRDLMAGVNPYQNFIHWKSDGHELTPPHFLNQAPSYPASVYVLMTPLALFDWPAAKQAWLFVNLWLIALIIIALQKSFPIESPLVLFLVVSAFLCCTPLRASLGAGQLNLLSLAAFVWSHEVAQGNGKYSNGLAGVLLAVSWVKYSLTFPLTLIFINQRRWQPVAIAVAVHTALTLLAAVKLNLWPHEFFFSSVEVVMMGYGTGFQNLSAIAMQFNLPTSVALILIISTMALATWQITRVPHSDPLVLLALLGLFSYAVFFHHHYDFIVLILLAWCIAHNKLNTSATVSALTLLIVAWMGLWITAELQAAFDAGNHLKQAIELLVEVSLYSTMILLILNIKQTKVQPARIRTDVLAF